MAERAGKTYVRFHGNPANYITPHPLYDTVNIDLPTLFISHSVFDRYFSLQFIRKPTVVPNVL